MRILKGILGNGKKAICPECGENIRVEEELCETCLAIPVIDEIFVLFNDGRLVDHFCRTLKPELEKDNDIRSSMIVALQNYIDGSMAHEIGSLQELKFGDRTIIVTPGKYIFIALVLERGEASGLRKMIKGAIEKVEEEFDHKLKRWDGDKAKLDPLKKQLKALLLA